MSSTVPVFGDFHSPPLIAVEDEQAGNPTDIGFFGAFGDMKTQPTKVMSGL
jgi:hypothetical protein